MKIELSAEEQQAIRYAFGEAKLAKITQVNKRLTYDRFNFWALAITGLAILWGSYAYFS